MMGGGVIWDEGKMTRQWPEGEEEAAERRWPREMLSLTSVPWARDHRRPLVTLSGLASGASTPDLDPLGDPERLRKD